MPPREALGLPNCNAECESPTCIQLLGIVMDEIRVYESGGETCGIPPLDDASFDRRCAYAVAKLRICRERLGAQQAL